MIYILLLEQNKIYVGYSERPIGVRFLEHFNYSASKWTNMYRPLQVLRVLEGGRKEENEMTLKMMEIYGWWNVRGGSWCKVEMNSCPPALMERQGLKMPIEIKTQKRTQKCSRCGRNSHEIQQCFAKTTISGENINDEYIFIDDDDDDDDDDNDDDDDDNEYSESFYSKVFKGETCFRCGRGSHFAKDCYAKTDTHVSLLYQGV